MLLTGKKGMMENWNGGILMLMFLLNSTIPTFRFSSLKKSTKNYL